MKVKFGMNNKQVAEWKDAYAEGCSAGQRGLSHFQNPYKNDDVRRDGWQRGWTAAEYNRGAK